METRLGVDTDPVETAGTRSKIVESFVATRDGETVNECC